MGEIRSLPPRKLPPTTHLSMPMLFDKSTKGHLLWEQGVAGSNPATSTRQEFKKTPSICWGFFISTTLSFVGFYNTYNSIFPPRLLPPNAIKTSTKYNKSNLFIL